MADKTLTAANSIITLAINDVFPIPVQLQGFGADAVMTNDALESVEILMGVDGKMSAGFVFVPYKWGVTLQADSDSNQLFDDWYQGQQQAREIFRASGVIILPAIRTKWSLARGVLSTYPPLPDVAKILQPRKFGITWESAQPSII